MSDLSLADFTPVLPHVFLSYFQDDKVASLHGKFLWIMEDFVANCQDLIVLRVGPVPESVDYVRVQV